MDQHIDEIIKNMGYADSSCLKYSRNGFSDIAISAHYKKVLIELSPYAVYIIDNAPFVLFYEEILDRDKQKSINKKIWNAQIPVTIVCGSGDVKVFSSCTIDRENLAFNEVTSLPAEQVDVNSPFSYWEITNQLFWVDYAKPFGGERLNDLLLSNLSEITNKLRNDYNVDFATKLILRLIFIRYLIDRGVNLDYNGFESDVEASRNSLLNLLNEKMELYKLFTHLKINFNGNLFEMDAEVDDPNLSTEALQTLYEFFSATLDIKTGQLSFFDLYDFNIIPIELISNIYEILLGEENRSKYNAFYTPHYIVDYILDSSVSRFIRDNGVCKVLDPSCGSGIFLVDSYRRMVERELHGATYTEDDEFLKSILIENIYGVDCNENAIDVAIFSLYLAMLDYKDSKTLKDFKLPSLKGNNLLVADFFDVDALREIEIIPFDFIVGNPPWGSKPGLHVDYCNSRGYSQYLQNNDTCRAFVLRSKDFCSANSQCCCSFVLHSKILYLKKIPSIKFREFLLKNTKISRIVELSSVRKRVFKHAVAPAAILSYSYPADVSLDNRFEYISMKPNLFFRLFNIVVIEKSDIKYVQQKMLVKYDWAWKTLVYGLSGDVDVIISLKSTYPMLREYIMSQNPAIINGRGVEYNDSNGSDMLDANHLLERPLLNSRGAIRSFALREKFEIFLKNRIHRVCNEALFHAPYCLVTKGIDTEDFSMRAVYSEKDFVFRDTIWALKGSIDQKAILLSITGLLNSNIYAYFNLMLGSSAGIEREQRFQNEVLNYPFVSSDAIAKQVEAIQGMSEHEEFTVSQDVSGEIEKLDRMILEAFNLARNSFVDYALSVQIPQLTNANNYRPFQAVNKQQLIDYAKPFLELLSAVYGVSGKFVAVNIFPIVAKYYSAVEIVLLDSKPLSEVQIINDLSSLQTALTRFSAHKINDMFFEVKDVIHFEEDSFYIIKPNHNKNWHPAIAQLDLAEAVDQILSRNGGND